MEWRVTVECKFLPVGNPVGGQPTLVKLAAWISEPQQLPQCANSILIVPRLVRGPDHAVTETETGGGEFNGNKKWRPAEIAAGMHDGPAIGKNVGIDFGIDDALKVVEQNDGLEMLQRYLAEDFVMGNLAAGYSNAGRTAEALALHEEVLAIRRRVLGLDHPDIWRT